MIVSSEEKKTKREEDVIKILQKEPEGLKIMARFALINDLLRKVEDDKAEYDNLLANQDPESIRLMSELTEKLESERFSIGRYGVKIDDVVSLLSPPPYNLPALYTGSNARGVQIHLPRTLRQDQTFEKIDLAFNSMFPGSKFKIYGPSLKSKCGNYDANFNLNLTNTGHTLTNDPEFQYEGNDVFGLKGISATMPGTTDAHGLYWTCRNCLTTPDYDEQECGCPNVLADGSKKKRPFIKIKNSARKETMVLSDVAQNTVSTKQFGFPLNNFVNASLLNNLEIGITLVGFTRSSSKLGVSRNITYNPPLGYKMNTKGILFEVNALPDAFIDEVFSQKFIIRDIIIDLIHDKILEGMRNNSRQIFELELFLGSCLRTLELDQYDDISFDFETKLTQINDPSWINDCINNEYQLQAAKWEGVRQGLTDDIVGQIFNVVSDAGFTRESIECKIRELITNSLAQLLYVTASFTSGSNFDDIDFLVRHNDGAEQIILYDSADGGNGACELIYNLLTIPTDQSYVFGNRTELSKPKYFDEGFTEMLLPCTQGVSERIFYQNLANVMGNNRSVTKLIRQLQVFSQENPDIAASIQATGIFNLFATFTGLNQLFGQGGEELDISDSYRYKNATDVCIHGCPDCISIGNKTKTEEVSERFSISKYLLDLLFRFHTDEIRITDNFDRAEIEKTLRKYNMVILTRTLANANQTADELETLIASFFGRTLDDKLYKTSGKWIDCSLSNTPIVEVSYLISLIAKPTLRGIPGTS
jgi:hypothetical protein